MTMRMLVIGLGFSGGAIAAEALRHGVAVTATSRDPGPPRPGPSVVPFDAAGEAIAAATHLVVTAPPGEAGDPVLLAHAAAVRDATSLRWVGYISTTGVYGDHGGAAVDETTPPTPGQPRSRRRRDAELAWEAVLAGRAALDLLRAGGIYGPGRSALDDLRAGTARRVSRPGHAFSRIYRDDIAQAVLAAALAPPPSGTRVLHLVDDEPAESAAVTEYAAALLGITPPPAIPFAEAERAMSPMARSFWAENRRVDNARTKAALGLRWRYPSFREGLAAILAEERQQFAPQQGEVLRP
ncbi:SDR family NAD(P)-dependent oxidoreductase [Roseomonas sp. BN140053]|uniref:SDR family NAD(P)-dependent oxidoreductase n=1 Tax=Roseomonas sp. BN140053 TaxID=3391898 RepID=UPI0039ED8A6D